MFRRQEKTLEADPVFPVDLKALGFFINQNGQTRMIDAPEKDFMFYATNNERVNELRREAMHECWRQEIEKRLSALGIGRIYLPDYTTTKPSEEHVPILSPPLEILKNGKRIIIIINDGTQDLGILAYRKVRDLGLNGASVVRFMKEVIARSAAKGDKVDENCSIFDDGYQVDEPSNIPAIVVLNTGQLLYSYKHNKAMTMRSWSAMPRKSSLHDMVKIHEVENRVEGHRNATEHVKSVFDDIFCNPERVAPNAELYVIAIEGGTQNVLDILEEDFEKYGSRIAAMALIHSLADASQIKNPNLKAFLHQRTREWKYSNLTIDPEHCVELPEHYSSQAPSSNADGGKDFTWTESVPKAGVLDNVSNALHRLAISVASSIKDNSINAPPRTEDGWLDGQTAVCPVFAAGNEAVGESIFTNRSVQCNILDFFYDVASGPENYRNPNFEVHNDVPLPTPDNPLVLDPDNTNAAGTLSFPPEMTPEQAEVDIAKEELLQMELSLKACPSDVVGLEKGRNNLIKKIASRKVNIKKLETKALASGGLGASEASKQRENWKPQKHGPEVPFAGTMVDSELLKAAGLVDTADEELEKLGGA